MRLDQALARIGAEIVKQETTPDGGTVLLIRAPKDQVNASRWIDTVKEFLVAAEQNNGQSWSSDVSKTYFSKDGTIRYLWRFVLGGAVPSAAGALGRAALRALSQGVEVTSAPLIGRKEYPFDPANGKLKGAHDSRVAASAMATAIRGAT